jgi:hypothetical protein
MHNLIRNLLYNRRRCDRIDQKYVMTSLFLCWRSTAEKIVYIFLQDLSKRIYPKENIEIRWAIENFAFDSKSFDEILPNQLGYFINWKQPVIRSTTLAAPRSGLV